MNRLGHGLAICIAALLILVMSSAALLRASVTDPFVPAHISNPDNLLAVLITSTKPNNIHYVPQQDDDGFPKDVILVPPPARRGWVRLPAWHDRLDLSPQGQVLPYVARAPPSLA